MPAKIGDLLVRNGLVSEDQLERALQAQLIFGGRLGTNLVELGFISTATLAEFLAAQLGMPCLRPGQLSEAAPAALEAVDPETASRYLVFPIAKEKRTLRLAMADPTDLRAVDEVAFRTGLAIDPVVAPELLIFYALERFYHVKRGNRAMLRMLNDLEGGLSVEAPWNAPREKPPAPAPDATGEYGLREAAADLVRAERNTVVLEVVQRYLRRDLQHVAVFVLDDDVARAWTQSGCVVPKEVPRDGVREPLRAIEVPIQRSVLFRSAVRASAPTRIPMPDRREDRVVGRLLEAEPADPLLLLPVRVGERNEAVALGAGEARPGALDGRAVQHYGLFASKVTDAIRMVRLRKRILAV